MDINILGIVGSLRGESYNRYLMKAFARRMPDGATLTFADIGALPHFDQDLETAAFPESAHALKSAIEAADALIIATPEYNRNIPGVLKNAIDWASRPYGKNSFARKPVLVVGASGGQLGAALAQYSLKQTLLYLDAHVLGQPEFHLSSASDTFDAEGNLLDEETKTYVANALNTLIAAAKSS